MSASFLDRAIAVFAPQAALKRAIARTSFQQLARRSYDGATQGRHLGAWRAQSTSADAEIESASGLLRARMRDLVRNNAYAAKAISALVTNLVGDGIMPTADTGSDAEDSLVNEIFAEWLSACDADNQLDFYGLQTLACREFLEAGEVLLRRRVRRKSDKLKIPLQVQILEADFLDSNRMAALSAAGYILGGIEFDQIGRRVGYWMHTEHPGGSIRSPLPGALLESKFIPADDIAHLYEKQRTQVRGVPWGTPALVSLRDLDDYDVAEARRKQMEACLVGVIISDDENDRQIAGRLTDADGNIVERMEPGIFPVMRNGKDIRFNQPAASGGYADYTRATLRKVAAGFRVPYELLTGDLSEVNYSSIRAGIVEFRRLVSSTQWQIIIPMACEPMWRWFTEAAFASGLIRSPVVPVSWAPPKFVSVDPLKDAAADLIAIRAGTMTLAEVITSRGLNVDRHLAEYARVNKLLDDLEIVLDSDPRQVNKAGSAQPDISAVVNSHVGAPQ